MWFDGKEPAFAGSLHVFPWIFPWGFIIYYILASLFSASLWFLLAFTGNIASSMATTFEGPGLGFL